MSREDSLANDRRRSGPAPRRRRARRPSRRTTTRRLVRAWPLLARQGEDRKEVSSRPARRPAVPPNPGSPAQQPNLDVPRLHERDYDEGVVAAAIRERDARGRHIEEVLQASLPERQRR